MPPLVPHPSAAGNFVGTSGWAYPSWRPGFYPAEVRPKDFLSFYASRLSSVEVNYTFRTPATEIQLQTWLAATTPPGFRFSFKAPQTITHFKRLRECSDEVAEFVRTLAPIRKAGKLGAVVFQLPPNFKANPDMLSALLQARSLRGKSAPKLAFEFRHPSWFVEDVYRVLRRHGAALCIAESEDLVTPDVQTAAHRYYRLRCPGGYSTRQLTAWAKRFAKLEAGGERYIYFKHEEQPTGALHAEAMLRRLRKLDGAGA